MARRDVVARGTPWRATYRRLAFGAAVGFAMLTLSNFEIGRRLYRAASSTISPGSCRSPSFPGPQRSRRRRRRDDRRGRSARRADRPRPWVIFAAVALIPFLDFGLRRITPDGTLPAPDLATAVTLISVLPLLVARIAAERAELQQADGTMRLLTQVIEQAQDLILVTTPDGAAGTPTGRSAGRWASRRKT